MRTVRIVSVSFLIAVAMLLTACGERAAAPPEPAEETRRMLTGGAVIGHRGEAGAQVWRALPYAAPPVGDLRWAAPRPHPGWSGVREALTPAARCPQRLNPLDQVDADRYGELVGEEDCLKLDVYAPIGAGPDDPSRPVMMWIHGGANVWGHADQYDGARLAQDQDVVVVVIQYRLGGLGFFAHPALREAAEIPADAAANFALLDIIAALDWIAENAAAFGGDASRITVFGESAGGHNVVGLLASPLAAGRFHRAIIQSGLVDSVPLGLAEGSDGADPLSGLAVSQRLAGPDATAQELRAATLEAVFAAFPTDENGRYDPPRVIADGISLPEGGLAAAFTADGGFNRVPIITGSNRDEMKLFNAIDPRYARRVLGLFPQPRDGALFDAVSDYQSRVWRIRAVDELAAALNAAGHEDVWAYRFDWDEGGRFLFTDTGRLLGAAHAMEIPFVFNRFSFFGAFDRYIFNTQNAEGRIALAEAMGAYWAAFARTGEPGDGEGAGPLWERWDADGALMRFDSPTDGGWAMMGGVDNLSTLARDLGADPRLDADERCIVADAVAQFHPPYGAQLAETLSCPV